MTARFERLVREFERREAAAELEKERFELLSLAKFTQSAWPILEPGNDLEWNWHLDLICAVLQCVTPPPNWDPLRDFWDDRRWFSHLSDEEWAQFLADPLPVGVAEDGRIHDLVINIAPRHLKSLMVGVFWPAWVWTWNPSHQWLTSSHSPDLATRDATKARRVIESEWYQARWPDVEFAEDENRITRYACTAGGHRITTSKGAGKLGEGGHTVMTDDPHKLIDGFVPEHDVRAATAWWRSVMAGRRNKRAGPDRSSRVVVMQRLDQLDVAGDCIRAGYHHLCLPTVMESDHEYRHAADPRKDGELLFPARFGARAVAEDREILGSYGFEGQHQQRPSPRGGGMLRRDWWRVVPRSQYPDTFDTIVVAADFSLKDKTTSDPTAVFALGRLGSRVYGLGRVYGRLNLRAKADAVRALVETYDANGIYLEDAAAADDVRQYLEDEIPGIVMSPPRGDKVVRAQVWAVYLEAGNLYLPQGEIWADELMTEAERFPTGKHDDQVDAWGLGVRKLLLRTERAAAVEVGPDMVGLGMDNYWRD